MHKIFRILLVSSFLTLTLSAESPQWFYNLKKNSVNYYIGYGQALTLKEAKSLALNDIASQISLRVKSSFSSLVQVKNDTSNKSLESKDSQKTDADISGSEVIKVAQIRNVFYVAIGYENIASLDKFVSIVHKKRPIADEKQSPYLRKTDLALKLKKSLGVNIGFSLMRKDKLWYLSYKDIRVSLSKRDFSKLLKSESHDSMRLGISKKGNKLFDGDVFHFKFKSDNKGYVSLLTVYENGTVVSLVNNVAIKADKMRNIPDADFDSELQAGLVESGEETVDLYVAIFSQEPLMFDSFASADESLVSQEKYKNFDTLIDFLDDKEFTTLKVVTKPR